MTRWTMTRDVAQHIVDVGEKKRHSMTQEVKSYPYEREEQVSLMTVASDWEKVDGVYSAQAYIKGFSGNQDSGSYTVYAPTSAEDSPPPIKKGSKIHVANVSGRLECIGGAGSSVKFGVAQITWNWSKVGEGTLYYSYYVASAKIYDTNLQFIEESTIHALSGYGYGEAGAQETRLCFHDGKKWCLLQVEPVSEDKITSMISEYVDDRLKNFSAQEITYVPSIDVSNGTIHFYYKTISVLVYKS